jgi:hypothetical protein
VEKIMNTKTYRFPGHHDPMTREQWLSEDTQQETPGGVGRVEATQTTEKQLSSILEAT